MACEQPVFGRVWLIFRGILSARGVAGRGVITKCRGRRMPLQAADAALSRAEITIVTVARNPKAQITDRQGLHPKA